MNAAIECLMPRGSSYSVVGQLLEREGRLYLGCDDGGEWRMDAPARARGMVGRSVRVEAIRDGHDLLAVEWIGAPDEPTARQPFVRSGFFAAGAASMLAFVSLAVAVACEFMSAR